MSGSYAKFLYVKGLDGCQLPEEYKEVQRLDEGGQAVVYTARLSPWVNVAIKRHKCPFDNAKTAENAYRELLLMQSISHENIVHLYDSFTSTETLVNFKDFYMVAFLSGRTLEALLQTRERFELYDVRIIIKQILNALVYLHKHDIIHRDLHPKNILADSLLSVKLIDFGLSTEDASGLTNVKELTAYVIAKHYRAPEVIREEQYTKSVDVWAAGCILYELLKGVRLFKHDIEAHILSEQEALFGDEKLAKVVVEELLSDDCLHFNNDAYKPKARDLFYQIMSISPKERISALDALTHAFLNGSPTRDSNVPQKLAYVLGDATTASLEEWRKLLFDHLRAGTWRTFVCGAITDHPSPPTSGWIPSFRSKCREDSSFSDEHALSYTQCAFRPFNEQKLVVRVLLADYRKAVEQMNQTNYNEVSAQERYAKYIELIHSTDDRFGERYKNYASDIQMLVDEHSGLALLIIDDSDMQVWSWLYKTEQWDVLGQRAHEIAVRLDIFINELNAVGITNYEVQFAQLTFYRDSKPTSSETSSKEIISVFQQTIVHLPSSLTFTVIDDVKLACHNHATVADAVLRCKNYQTDCTIMICRKDALEPATKTTEKKNITRKKEPQTSRNWSFALRNTTEFVNSEKDVKEAFAINEMRALTKQMSSGWETEPAAMRIRMSSNNRRIWAFGRDGMLIAADFNGQNQMTFNPKARECAHVEDFVVVNPSTLIVLGWDYLALVCLYPEDEQYEATVLEKSNAFAYVFAEITGTNVDVPQAVLNKDFAEHICCVRLDIDQPRLQMDWSYYAGAELKRCFYHLGRSGLLYAMRRNVPEQLFTFHLSEKMGICNEFISNPQDVPAFPSVDSVNKTDEHDDFNIHPCVQFDLIRGVRTFWSPTYMYSYGFEIVNNALQYSLHCCNLESPQWEKIGVLATPIHHIFVKVNAETGCDEELLVITITDKGEPEYVELSLIRANSSAQEPQATCVNPKTTTFSSSAHSSSTAGKNIVTSVFLQWVVRFLRCCFNTPRHKPQPPSSSNCDSSCGPPENGH